MECVLLRLEIHMEFTQLFQHQSNVLTIFSQVPGVYKVSMYTRKKNDEDTPATPHSCNLGTQYDAILIVPSICHKTSSPGPLSAS